MHAPPRCLPNLDNVKLSSADEQIGVQIVQKALRTPCWTIAKNAGVDPSLVVDKVLSAQNINEGFDALHDRYVDMIQEGMYLWERTFPDLKDDSIMSTANEDS